MIKTSNNRSSYDTVTTGSLMEDPKQKDLQESLKKIFSERLAFLPAEDLLHELKMTNQKKITSSYLQVEKLLTLVEELFKRIPLGHPLREPLHDIWSNVSVLRRLKLADHPVEQLVEDIAFVHPAALEAIEQETSRQLDKHLQEATKAELAKLTSAQLLLVCHSVFDPDFTQKIASHVAEDTKEKQIERTCMKLATAKERCSDISLQDALKFNTFPLTDLQQEFVKDLVQDIVFLCKETNQSQLLAQMIGKKTKADDLERAFIDWGQGICQPVFIPKSKTIDLSSATQKKRLETLLEQITKTSQEELQKSSYESLEQHKDKPILFAFLEKCQELSIVQNEDPISDTTFRYLGCSKNPLERILFNYISNVSANELVMVMRRGDIKATLLDFHLLHAEKEKVAKALLELLPIEKLEQALRKSHLLHVTENAQLLLSRIARAKKDSLQQKALAIYANNKKGLEEVLTPHLQKSTSTLADAILLQKEKLPKHSSVSSFSLRSIGRIWDMFCGKIYSSSYAHYKEIAQTFIQGMNGIDLGEEGNLFLEELISITGTSQETFLRLYNAHELVVKQILENFDFRRKVLSSEKLAEKLLARGTLFSQLCANDALRQECYRYSAFQRAFTLREDLLKKYGSERDLRNCPFRYDSIADLIQALK